MGGSTKTVGGGSATGVANDFNGFLKQGLNNGSFGAVGQTTGMGATLNGLLQGRQGDPTGLNDYQQTLKQMQGTGAYQPQQIQGQGSANPLDDPSHPFNQLMGQLQSQNLMQGFGGQANIGQFGAQSGQISNIMNQVGSQANLGNLNGGINNLNQAASMTGQAAQNPFFTRTPTDINNSSYANAMQTLLQNKQQRDIADLRARYSITGGSQGTPAAQAEQLYRNDATSQLAAAMGQINQGEQGLDLQAAGINSQNQLGNSGQAIQALTAAGGLGATQRDQNLQNQLGNRNADISAGNMSVANASQMNQANVAARGQDLQNYVNSRGLDLQQLGLQNSSLLSQAGLGFNAGQAGMQNNQFNSNQNFNAQSANATNGLNAQNLFQQQMANTGNLAIQGGQLNLNNANSNTQNQQAAMNMLMQMFGQANQLGTPQAQNVQTPGFLGQLGSAASGIGNIFGALSGSGLMGNSGGGMQPGGGSYTPPYTGGIQNPNIPPFQMPPLTASPMFNPNILSNAPQNVRGY